MGSRYYCSNYIQPEDSKSDDLLIADSHCVKWKHYYRQLKAIRHNYTVKNSLLGKGLSCVSQLVKTKTTVFKTLIVLESSIVCLVLVLKDVLVILETTVWQACEQTNTQTALYSNAGFTLDYIFVY